MQTKKISHKLENNGPAKGWFRNLQDRSENLVSIGLFVALALVLRASVVEAFKIPSSSMEKTLLIGDHILVNKLSYGLRLPLQESPLWRYSEPVRGDIVVFTRPDDPLTPEDESETNIIKRVIGLPGDMVEVRGMAVRINGRELVETYPQWRYGGQYDFGPSVVPPDHVLLMGDNRDESYDSRRWQLAGRPSPFLPEERIKGRAFVIYWNLNHLDRIFDVLR